MPSWAWPADAYRDAIAAPARSTYITGTITKPDGNATTFGDTELMSGSLSVSADMAQGDTLLPGAVPTTELRISLVDDLADYLVYGAEIMPCFNIILADGSPYEVPLGVFTICETEQSDGYYTLTAYDALKKFDNIRFDALPIETGKVYTPYEIIALCTNAVDLSLNLDDKTCAAMPNGDVTYMISNLLQNSAIETARDLLMHTVQTLCAFARVDRWGALEIVPLTPPASAWCTITEKQRTRSSFTDPAYRLYALETVVNLPQTDDSTTYGDIKIRDMSLYADGITVTLPENPLWGVSVFSSSSRQAELYQRIKAIREQLELCTYMPCTAETFGDPTISLFDWITYTGRTAGEGIMAPITSCVWRYHGTQTLSACGSDAVAGVVKSQAEKAAAAARMQMYGSVTNVMRGTYLKLMQQSHAAMGTFTHADLAHYTHAELGGGTEL